jgi:hypothetical protein
LRLDVEDDLCERVVVCGLGRELDLGERDNSESDDDEGGRCGDAGNVFHRDFLSRCRQKLAKLTGGRITSVPWLSTTGKAAHGVRSRLAIWTALQKRGDPNRATIKVLPVCAVRHPVASGCLILEQRFVTERSMEAGRRYKPSPMPH